ncbi:hypothetical protein SDJN03_23521, partial [Cucurbita argyrosperma subsp. sororia]
MSIHATLFVTLHSSSLHDLSPIFAHVGRCCGTKNASTKRQQQEFSCYRELRSQARSRDFDVLMIFVHIEECKRMILHDEMKRKLIPDSACRSSVRLCSHTIQWLHGQKRT